MDIANRIKRETLRKGVVDYCLSFRIWISIFVLFILFVTSSSIVYGQVRLLDPTKHLTISEGLAHNGVTSILEDSKGYLWIGTFDGLNRYDGYEFKLYRNTTDKKILVSNRIRTISEDSRGNLWLGTDEGISLFDHEKERFQDIYSNKLTNQRRRGPVIRKVFFDDLSGIVICVSENNGLLLFGSDYTFIEQYLPSDLQFDGAIQFFDGLKLDKRNYLIATSKGLLLFNTETKKFQKTLEEQISYCNTLLKIDSSNIVITLERGIAILESSIEYESYVFQLSRKDLLEGQYNSSMLDSLGNLWLGTLRDGFIHIDNIHSFSSREQYTLSSFKGSSGYLRNSTFYTSGNSGWVGTFDQGIYIFDLNEKLFKNYKVNEYDDYGLFSDDIQSITPLDSHRVYVTSLPSGLTLFNSQSGQFEALPFTIDDYVRSLVAAVFIDSKGNTWLRLMDNHGVYIIRRGRSSIEKVKSHELSILANQFRFYTTKEDRAGNLWIGGTVDVCKLTISSESQLESIEQLKEHPFFSSRNISPVRYLYVDPKFDFIWIGTMADGLLRIRYDDTSDLKDMELHQYVNIPNVDSSISSNSVSYISRLPNGELWIGTEGGGICKVINSENVPSFTTYSESKGLSNSVVKNLLYDNENLWISTNIGLNKFDLQNLTFRNFHKADGLPFEGFKYAGRRLDNGLVLVSGSQGFCFFDPEKLSNKESIPKLEFGELRILNLAIAPGDTIGDRLLLETGLTDKQEIRLKHYENIFSIGINSLHYSNPKSHLLRHQLMPVHQDWIEVPSSQRIISYNGLQPGEYVLRVMASNSLGEWSEAKELKITITPPFWKTGYAYLLYSMLIGGLLYLSMLVILRIQSLNHNLQIEKIEKENVRELNIAKLRFFSNISHEIKTPITLISGPVKLLIDRFKSDKEVNKRLRLIQRQSNKIAQLVDQVHGFQKADANLLKMFTSHFCFDSFINELIADFEFMAQNQGKHLKVHGGGGARIFVWADRDKLEIICNNLLNNAFKYTEKGDSVSVNYREEGNNLFISVSDTGRGIGSDDLPYIFDRFYQSPKIGQAHIDGAGIGLSFSKRLIDMHYGFIDVSSEKDKGSTFDLRLPIVKHLSDKEQLGIEAKILLMEDDFSPASQINKEVDLSSITTAYEFSEARIFYVEDNLDMRDFVSEILSNFFKVQTFSDGKKCLNAMDTQWPDLIISDVMMPDINGLELCKRVKSDVKTSHVPIILLTASTTMDDQILGIKEGADAYIRKPFDIQHLISKTEALLYSRKQLRERFQGELPLTLDRESVTDGDFAFLEKLYSLLADNLDNQELDLDDFAQSLFLNRTHFYQKVKALTNQTPYELLRPID